MASSESTSSVGALEHVGIVVADLARAKSFFAGVLGLVLSHEAVVADGALTTAFFHVGPALVELIEVRDSGPRQERLGDAEARIEHLAFRVHDLSETAARLRDHGVRLGGGIGSWGSHGSDPMRVGSTLNLFSDPASSGGLLLQLVERGS